MQNNKKVVLISGTSSGIGRYLASKLSKKYNKTIDRHSAYELLGAKIKRINDMRPQQDSNQTPKRKGRQRQHPIVKVLTSTTFIRAVFGILKKVV